MMRTADTDRESLTAAGRRCAASNRRLVVGMGVLAALLVVVAAAVALVLWRPWRNRSGRHDVYMSFEARGAEAWPRASLRVRRVDPSLPGTLVDEGDDEVASRFTLVMQRALMGRVTEVEVEPEQVVVERRDGSAARILFAQRRVEEREVGSSAWLWAAELPEGTCARWTMPVRNDGGGGSDDPFLHIVAGLDADAMTRCAGASTVDALIATGGRLWGSARLELRRSRHLSPMPVRVFDGPADAGGAGDHGRRIPPRVFQTFRRIDGRVPTRMRATMLRWAESEPGLEHYFYDDEACRDMVARHFGGRVLRAYDALVPTAYKADLWRACVLLLYGGFYFDVKVNPARGMRLLREVGPDVDVLLASDRPALKRLGRRRDGMWNAIMGFRRGHPMLRAYIDAIVSNTERRFYGETTLDITGPRLLGRIAAEWYGLGRDFRYSGPPRQLRGCDGARDTLLLWHMCHPPTWPYCKVWSGANRDRLVLEGEYSGYRTDQREFETCKHYSALWLARRVYGEPPSAAPADN